MKKKQKQNGMRILVEFKRRLNCLKSETNNSRAAARGNTQKIFIYICDTKLQNRCTMEGVCFALMVFPSCES